jgi:hypothetical protein
MILASLFPTSTLLEPCPDQRRIGVNGSVGGQRDRLLGQDLISKMLDTAQLIDKESI